MAELTPEGQRIAHDLVAQTGFSFDAVRHMMFAVWEGNGSMAQFNHPEFAGSGQWMSGGMLMLGDMFNHGLKGRVDGLCQAIAGYLARDPSLLRSGSFQSQSQSGGGQQQQSGGGGWAMSSPPSGGSLFVPDRSVQWWPEDLGMPAASGAQNNVRYAYFPDRRRLAVEVMGDVWVYDCQDHQIGGFSQQQGGGGSILFQSQYGTVNLASLPVVFRNGAAVVREQPTTSPPDTSDSNARDPLGALERLGELRAKGIVTEDEFQAKKAELLKRL